MKRCSSRQAILSGLIGLLAITVALSPGQPAWAKHYPWKLVWSDEFEQEGLPDPQKWGYEEGFVRNRELQYYTKDRTENARVENGVLILEARREPWKNTRPDFRKKKAAQAGSSPASVYQRPAMAAYTSASLKTLGKASWTYARIEVRARLPQGTGVWPAIWTLGTNKQEVGWPACGELDIMEHVGYAPHIIQANVHCTKSRAQKLNNEAKIKIVDPAEKFHLYSMNWSEKQIDFFVDRKKYQTYKNDGSGEAAWPFDKPQYLLLNLAIGGSWGGAQGVDDSIFPQRMEVDYVRVYQRVP
jgi:beta-glucanase (GH16 family)